MIGGRSCRVVKGYITYWPISEELYQGNLQEAIGSYGNGRGAKAECSLTVTLHLGLIPVDHELFSAFQQNFASE